jgi:hypothetical protein
MYSSFPQLKQKRPSRKDGLGVEMRGIEPRSEEKTTRTSTSVVFSGELACGTGENSALTG